MSMHQKSDLIRPQRDRGAELSVARSRTNDSHLRDLVEVLRDHPSGLRRWSVMRLMRSRHELKGREVSQKFEDEVERAFRNRCASETPSETPSEANAETAAETAVQVPGRLNDVALFYRPKERAGEVWAVFRERAEEWLRAERSDSLT
jgi:hypothetical protein